MPALNKTRNATTNSTMELVPETISRSNRYFNKSPLFQDSFVASVKWFRREAPSRTLVANNRTSSLRELFARFGTERAGLENPFGTRS